MLENFYKAEYPSYLQTNDFAFNLSSILKDSVYFVVTRSPSLKFVELLSDNVFSYIVVSDFVFDSGIDYIKSKKQFGRYNHIHSERVQLSKMQPYLIDHPSNRNDSLIDRGLVEWNIYEKPNGLRISVLLIVDSCINAFKQLYLNHKSFPRVVINQEGRQNWEWKDFVKSEEFSNIIYNQKYQTPIYLLVTGFGGLRINETVDFHDWIDFPNKLEGIDIFNVYVNDDNDQRQLDVVKRYVSYIRKVFGASFIECSDSILEMEVEYLLSVNNNFRLELNNKIVEIYSSCSIKVDLSWIEE